METKKERGSMADILTSARRSPLEGIRESGEFGTIPFSGPGIRLEERAPYSLVQIEARADALPVLNEAMAVAIGAAPSLEPNRSVAAGKSRILGTGTNRWLVIEPEERDLAAHLRATLPEAVAVTDLGHARTALRVSGRDTRMLLAKGTAIDLHPSAFGVDRSRMTSLFHASVLIECRSADPVYDIYVHRSYAVHLWEMLLDGALEFGCYVA